MRALSPALADHIASDVTTLATCWRLIRRDGVMLGFTTHDQDLMVNGQRFRAATGFAPTAIASSNALNVDNLEVDGALSSEAITSADLRAGRFDFARIEIFLVNWQAPEQGVIMLRTGFLGEVRTEDERFSVEVRGLKQMLQHPIGDAFSPECRADLGDRRCRVTLRGFTQGGLVTSVSGPASFVAADLTQPDGWFRYGMLRWHSGGNAGLDFEIKSQSGTALSLIQAPPAPIEAGDRFDIMAGCDKSFSTCRDKFDNVLNFRGEPHVPGIDSLLDYPGLQ